jgi:hypothetical protein
MTSSSEAVPPQLWTCLHLCVQASLEVPSRLPPTRLQKNKFINSVSVCCKIYLTQDNNASKRGGVMWDASGWNSASKQSDLSLAIFLPKVYKAEPGSIKGKWAWALCRNSANGNISEWLPNCTILNVWKLCRLRTGTLSSCLTRNTLRLSYRAQPVNAV